MSENSYSRFFRGMKHEHKPITKRPKQSSSETTSSTTIASTEGASGRSALDISVADLARTMPRPSPPPSWLDDFGREPPPARTLGEVLRDNPEARYNPETMRAERTTIYINLGDGSTSERMQYWDEQRRQWRTA